jgi:subtilisin family serine protease
MKPIRMLAVAGGITSALLTTFFAPVVAQTDISPEALQQIQDLLQEKESRTEAQRKLASQLVYAWKESLGQQLTTSIDVLPSLASLDTTAYGVLVDLRASVSTTLLEMIEQAGGNIITASPADQSIRARIPLDQVESLASLGDVQFIRPAAHAKASRVEKPRLQAQSRRSRTRPIIERLLGPQWFGVDDPGVNSPVGSLTTQGDITHAANLARSIYGVNGAGVRVGVLSDSAEATSFLIGTGDLPPDTTIVEEIINGPGTSEGTAMMEIVSDLAPGAQLFFASAFNGESSFANNIRTLRNVYNCDVIVDDVSYSDEFPFQDGIIARAVNDVTASGAIYFSSAGNGGNITSGTSSTWEGDFVDGGTSALIPGHTLHTFGGQAFNRVLATTPVLDLFWSDPIGASSNDYDLFVLNSAGTAVIAASTDVQTGSQDPFEEVFSPNGFPANSRIVIAAKTGAATRALHLESFFGTPLELTTAGATRGHNAGPSTVSVAAVGWMSARLGTRPFVGGDRDPTEVFSSDGPRKMFYLPDGTPITPGNLLFGTDGGTTFIKPDIAAADGVTTRTPGFNPFYGTSAAAPHAAGIAALVKSANPSATVGEIYTALISSALDIRATGIDRDAGYGLIMAPPSVAAAVAEGLGRQ